MKRGFKIKKKFSFLYEGFYCIRRRQQIHISLLFIQTYSFVNCFIILAQVNAIEATSLKKVEIVTIMRAISYNFEVG